MRAPDVAFVRKDHVPPSDERHKFAELAPDLAVEVISPNDKPAEIEEKVSDYQAAGVRLIWVVYPAKKCVVEYRPDTPSKTLGLGDALEGHDVLPGFTCRLPDLLA